MQWQNEPPVWQAQGKTVTAQAATGTGSWFRVRGGRTVHVPHFYCEAITGSFRAQVKVIYHPDSQFDEAGLLVQLDDRSWLKFSIEAGQDVDQAKWVVARRNWLDRDYHPLPESHAYWLRVERQDTTFDLSLSSDGISYSVVHQAILTKCQKAEVGIIISSPMGSGFASRFEELEIVQQASAVQDQHRHASH